MNECQSCSNDTHLKDSHTKFCIGCLDIFILKCQEQIFQFSEEGNNLRDQHFYQKAVELYENAIKAYQDHNQACIAQGLIHMILGDALRNIGLDIEAYESYRREIDLREEIQQIKHQKAHCLIMLCELKEAASLGQEIQQKNPDAQFESQNFNLVQFSQACSVFSAPNYLLGLEQQNLYKQGERLFDQGEDEEALKKFEQAIQINDNFEIAWSYKGHCLYNLKRYEEAIKSYTQALNLNPKCKDTFKDKGDALFSLEQFQEAIFCYNEALKIDKQFGEAYLKKGDALVILKKYPEAIQNYEEAIKNLQLNLKLYKNQETPLQIKNDSLLFLQKKVPEDHLENIINNIRQAYVSKGLALENLDKYDEAIKCYEEAQQFNDFSKNIFKV